MTPRESERSSRRVACLPFVRATCCFMATLLLALTALGCDTSEMSERRKLQDYVRNSYYSSLAKARGDVVKEWATFVSTATKEQSPTDDAELKMFRIVKKWMNVATNFEEVTAQDASNPELRLIRDKYLEADNLLTYAITEYWLALAPRLSKQIQREHLVNSASAYENAVKVLTAAHATTEQLLHSR